MYAPRPHPAATPLSFLPVWAEHKVAAAVSSRVSQKAELMQYLAGHTSTVGRMLHSIPEANPAAGGTAPTAGGFSATAPAAVVPGARKSSVSAYLAGQQDLLTTITDGVPYASGLPGMLGAGSSNSTAAASMRCSTASYCSGSSSSSILSAQSTGGAASSSPSAANSRHTAVKEALSARISSAGEQFLAQLEP